MISHNLIQVVFTAKERNRRYEIAFPEIRIN